MNRRSKTSKATVQSPHDYYCLSCACGEILEGRRGSTSQRIECPGCGESHYVLPADVYPRPQILPPLPQLDEEPEVDFDLLEGTDLAPPPEPDFEFEIEEIKPPAPRRPAEPTAPPRRIWVDKTGRSVVRRRIVQIALGASVLLGLTIWWGAHNRKLARAEVTLREELGRAEEAVGDRDWKQARESAQAATRAADVIGDETPTARRARQLYVSLAAFERMSAFVPIEIVLQKAEGQYTKETWDEEFRIHHAGSWLVIVADVVRETRKVDDEEIRYLRVDYPLSLDSDDVRLQWDREPDWIEFVKFNKKRARVCFAAKMQRVQFPKKDDASRWNIVLDADESFLWSEDALAQELGLIAQGAPESKEIRDLLAQQQAALGIPKREEL